MLERGAGLDDMHCSRNHARSCTCRDVCTGILDMLKYMFMYMKLGLQRRISDPGKVLMHALASALQLHGCALAMCVILLKIQASIHVHVHELHSAEHRCMVRSTVSYIHWRGVPGPLRYIPTVNVGKVVLPCTANGSDYCSC